MINQYRAYLLGLCHLLRLVSIHIHDRLVTGQRYDLVLEPFPSRFDQLQLLLARLDTLKFSIVILLEFLPISFHQVGTCLFKQVRFAQGYQAKVHLGFDILPQQSFFGLLLCFEVRGDVDCFPLQLAQVTRSVSVRFGPFADQLAQFSYVVTAYSRSDVLSRR